jgi:hypothetical protein
MRSSGRIDVPEYTMAMQAVRLTGTVHCRAATERTAARAVRVAGRHEAGDSFDNDEIAVITFDPKVAIAEFRDTHVMSAP